MAALRAAGIAQHRRHPAASRSCARSHPGAGPPCPAPFKSDTLRPRADVTALASVGTARPRARRRILRLALLSPDTLTRRPPRAGSVCGSRTLAGLFFGGPPGRRLARRPPASCVLLGRATDQRSAGILAGGASRSDNLADGCADHGDAQIWSTRNLTSARQCDPVRIGREPGKDARLPCDPSRTG